MPDSKPQKQNRNTNSSAFVIAEYSSLRDEILKQVDFQHQLIALSLVIVGTFLSLGTQSTTEPVLLLAYPILSVFLVLGWSSSRIRIQRIKLYIKDQIESQIAEAGWEQYYSAKTKRIKRSMSILYARGVFVGTQVVAIVVALPRLSFSELELSLFAADIVAIIATLYLIRPNRQPWV